MTIINLIISREADCLSMVGIILTSKYYIFNVCLIELEFPLV